VLRDLGKAKTHEADRLVDIIYDGIVTIKTEYESSATLSKTAHSTYPDILSFSGVLPGFAYYHASPVVVCRKFVMSRNGGAPNKRPYSRLNWEGLS
jgi:hypothetical protein